MPNLACNNMPNGLFSYFTAHQELITLIPVVEAKTVERLSYLIELSFLWETTVDEVMKRLDIKPPPTIHA